MRVPVRHWRTLFHYLGRLSATFDEARADGRAWVNWHVREDGVIWVSAWELTEAEQAQRAALPAAYTSTPWTRPALQLEPAWTALTPCTALTPPLHQGHTTLTPEPHPTTTTARAPPIPNIRPSRRRPGSRATNPNLPRTPHRSLRALVLGGRDRAVHSTWWSNPLRLIDTSETYQ